MPRKEELLGMAKDLGLTLPEGNLSKDEIGALLRDHMSKAKEVGETEYKLKPDPMTGLSRLTRDRLRRNSFQRDPQENPIS
jgi:hypothetical protein